MYTLLNGSKVEELCFHSTGVEAWEQSQYFWQNGIKTCFLYNTETGEVRCVDAMGREVINFEF